MGRVAVDGARARPCHCSLPRAPAWTPANRWLRRRMGAARQCRANPTQVAPYVDQPQSRPRFSPCSSM